jgi:bifunctional DNase/RNase
MSQQRVVILRQVESERYLAIWIDPYMAETITLALQEVEVVRPLTHDLMRSILRQLNARILRVEVAALRGEVYYGNIVVEVNGEAIEIDARPSDCLALAVRANVPIYVAVDVMDSAGIIPEEDVSESAPGEQEPSAPPPAGMDDERLSIFEDFLSQIELEDAPDDEDEAYDDEEED